MIVFRESTETSCCLEKHLDRSSGQSLKKHKVMFFLVMFTIHAMKTVISLIKIQLGNRAGDTKL